MKLESLESRDLLFACNPLTTPLLAGDVNADGQVNFADFLQLSGNFGSPGDRGSGDLDGDGFVAFGDFLILSGNFGNELSEDLNGDGQATIEDAYFLRDKVLGGGEYEPELDVNADGVIDAADLHDLGEQLQHRYGSGPADINLDCVIDEADAKIVVDNFGSEVIGGWIDGDLDQDGTVAFADFIETDPSPF